jgi:hypothetical protein
MLTRQDSRKILLIAILFGFSSFTCHAWADTQSGLNGFGQICHDDIEIITIENPPDEEGPTKE